jgi:excisionase family DNA binding protein
MDSSTPAPTWLTRQQVADRLQVPVKTLAEWASRKIGPRYARFGRHCRYRLDDIEAWENAQVTGGAA